MRSLFLSIAAVALLSGCYSNSTPQGTVKSVGAALHQGDMKAFSGFLTAEAKAKFAHEPEFTALRADFARYENLTLGQETLVGMEGDATRTRITVFGDSVRVGDVYVDCVSQSNRLPSECEYDGYRMRCYPGRPSYDQRVTSCYVSDFVR